MCKSKFPLLDTLLRCRYCGIQLEATTNGRQRKFCCDSHRKMFNKRQSTSELAKLYKALATEFFSINNAHDRQTQIEEWGIKYAYWCNGEMPSFFKTKEALLNSFIPRDKVWNEEGKNINVRLVAHLREKVPNKQIYDRLAVVRAFGLEPSASLLAEQEATETPAPSKPVERSQKPSEPASLIHAPMPAKPVQPAPVEADEDAELLAAFSEFFGDDSDRKEPAPVACEETRPAPIQINPSYAACVKMSFDKIGDIREDFLFRRFEEYDYPLKATLSAMVEEGSIIKTKKAEGVFYRIANNEANEKADFWAECLRYAKGDMTKARTSFRNVFDLWPSKEIQETSVDLSIEPSVANVRRIEEGRRRYFDEKKKAA